MKNITSGIFHLLLDSFFTLLYQVLVLGALSHQMGAVIQPRDVIQPLSSVT